jgi:hypothetical protein
MRRLLVILTACCAVLATAACSGDDDGKDKESGDKPPASRTTEDAKETKVRAAKTTPCTAEVSTTGAYEAEWSGDAEVRTGGKPVDDTGPKAVYTLSDMKNRVTLYSPGSEFKGAIALSVGDTAYASDPADAESFDIDEKGKSASVDVTLTSTGGGETIDLVADFDCGKTKKR